MSHDPALTECEAGVLVECCHWSELTPDRDSAGAAFREHIARAWDTHPAEVPLRVEPRALPLLATGAAFWVASLVEVVLR